MSNVVFPVIMEPAWTVESKDVGGNLSTGDDRKTITVSSASAQVLTLPLLTGSDISTMYTVAKLGAGQVTIQANTGQYIADSAATGTIVNYKADEVYATVTLQAVTTTQWIVVGAHGTWETS